MNYNINNICTSPEQSKKLVELGIDVNTADMWWAERYEGVVTENGQYVVAEYPYYYLSLTKPSDTNYSQDTIKDIPAWSLAALLEQLDDAAGLAKDYGLWFCYDNRKSCYTKHYDNPVDACYEMIEKLKEKG